MQKIKLILIIILLSHTSLAALSLKSISGENLITKQPTQIDISNKMGLVVVFLSAKCPCSNSHNIELKELSEKYSDFNFVAIHSNKDEPFSLSEPYFKKAQFTFPVIEDQNNKLANQLQAFKTPHAYILNSSGDIVYQGGVSNSTDCSKSDRKYLREALEDLAHHQKVRTPEGRTLGCAIPR